MGYMRHHAIVVTSWQDEAIEHAHRLASEVFSWVSPISPSATNGNRSFFVPPDGSKEGWEESHLGDNRRGKFIKALRNLPGQRRRCEWVEVQYGDDEGESKVCRHSDEEQAEKEAKA